MKKLLLTTLLTSTIYGAASCPDNQVCPTLDAKDPLFVSKAFVENGKHMDIMRHNVKTLENRLLQVSSELYDERQQRVLAGRDLRTFDERMRAAQEAERQSKMDLHIVSCQLTATRQMLERINEILQTTQQELEDAKKDLVLTKLEYDLKSKRGN